MINSVGNVYRPMTYQVQTQRQTQPIFTGEENKKEGKSKTSKTLLGLGALAAVAVGGLLLKRRIDLKNANKLFKENFVSNFEKEFGKMDQLDKSFDIDFILPEIRNLLAVKNIKSLAQFEKSGYKISVQRLDKKGLESLAQGREIPETLLGKKDGVLIMLHDKNNKVIANKGFIADEIGPCLKEDIFYKDSLVELKPTEITY